MIHLDGAVRRSFIFPADRALAYAYYGDVARVLTFLPHICLVRAYGPDRFRLLYVSRELGTYHIHIYADVQTILEDDRIIRIKALEGHQAVPAAATLTSATTHGHFESESVFHDLGDQTRIEYGLQLRGSLPRPKGLRLMPRRMVSQIARGITQMRIREITDGFIERSLSAFPDWLAELGNDAGLSQSSPPRSHKR